MRSLTYTVLYSTDTLYIYLSTRANTPAESSGDFDLKNAEFKLCTNVTGCMATAVPRHLPYSTGMLSLLHKDILRDQCLGKSDMTSPHAFPPPPKCSVLAFREQSHVRPDT